MNKKLNLFVKVLPVVVVILFLKLLAHYMNLEILSLNSLFSGIVAANVFLMGFLLSGVLGDYKESEKLPGEIAASILAIVDEISIIQMSKKSNVAKEALQSMLELSNSIEKWFYKKEKTKVLMDKIAGLNNYFQLFESLTQANFIVRMKQDQNNIRRIITRIHTIRETNFVSAGYFIAAFTTILLSAGLILAKIDPFYESLFFVGVISFLLVYLLFLIRDLDNPFGYYEKSSIEDVSLKPLTDLINTLKS